MNPDAIARRALEHADHRSPDATIRAALRDHGIDGGWSSPEYRAAYLEIEREWRPLFLRRTDRTAFCARCEKPLEPQQRKWCSRDCWSLARAKGEDLTERDAEIVRLRREEGESKTSIGRRYGISATRVQQILQREAA